MVRRWTRVVDKKLPRLLDILHACIVHFEYPGRLELRAQLKAPLLTAGERGRAFRDNYGGVYQASIYCCWL